MSGHIAVAIGLREHAGYGVAFGLCSCHRISVLPNLMLVLKVMVDRGVAIYYIEAGAIELRQMAAFAKPVLAHLLNSWNSDGKICSMHQHWRYCA